MNTKKGILGNKAYLYLTEFFAGMAVMAVELGASRLLAPYFSSSQIVWTIIIGTIMIAMALGNVYGGRKADKDPDPDRLYKRILIAAIWIAAIPVLGKYVIAGVSGLLIFTVNTGFLVIAAFISCMVVFVFPLFLLGTVTPSLVKYTTDNLEENGKVVGMLGATNTIGSILGTFLPTFVTIPSVGTAISFLIFGGILLLLALLYFISEKRKKVAAIVSSILFVLCCIFGHDSSFAFWEKDLAYEGESVYNYLQVKEDDRQVALSTNVLFGVQSILMKQDELTGMYYDYALAAPFMAGLSDQSNGGKLLVLGNGSGTFAKQCRNYFDGISVEAVEIDDRITDLAYEYFELDEDIPVYTYDGRAFLATADEKYDVIMVDAYQDITIPFQMSSAKFFTMVREHLKPHGVMVVNLNMYSDEAGAINEWLCDTIAAVFPETYTVDVPYATNRELFASMGGARERFSAGCAALENGELRAMMARVDGGLAPYTGGGNVFTDDKAPVELLGMRVIDGLIGDELDEVRGVYEEKGFSGLMEMMG
jgi:spermidine synthase